MADLLTEREGNIKQTPQPTLVVADSPKKEKNQYGAINVFLGAAAVGLSSSACLLERIEWPRLCLLHKLVCDGAFALVSIGVVF